jgi:hypothetical protein
MKKLLALLLIIPSLSWGEVIWLSCQKYKTTTYEGGEVSTRELSNGYKDLYGLHNIDPIRLFVYPANKYDLEEADDYKYKFSETTSSGNTFRYFLNRYTYEIFFESIIGDKRSASFRSHCEIVDRKL